MPRLLTLLLLGSLSACGGNDPGKGEPEGEDGGEEGEEELPPPDRVAGPPVAGMAEAYLDLPVGAPLGGYTGRCNCFGNEGEVDKRQSAYVNNFNPSAGVQTRPMVQVLWLENGDQAIAMAQTDAIYTYEGIVDALEERLTAATGMDMEGRVTLSASHSHSAPANWDKGMTWFLGGDRYNEEVFQRVVDSMEGAFLTAWEAREPAAIGIGQAKDWDPTDQVYSDRRNENNERQFFDDIPAGTYKDPYLTVLRVDHLDGQPMGMFVAFGMHGTTLGGDNQLWSNEAPGHIEFPLRERFDSPVVVGMMQHGGGDASPRGRDDGLARLESVGELAVDAIYALWEATPTSADPLVLETVSHTFASARDDIRVTRGGTVDFRYAPYDPDGEPDEQVFGPDGEVLSPIDEFNTRYGGAFCGDDSPLLPGVGIGSEAFPYSSCVDVETIAFIIAGFFGLPEAILPLPESTRTSVTGSYWGGVAYRAPDGTVSTTDVMWGFLPGETTAVYTETFRRRVVAELGIPVGIPVGYSQDHQGYLLTTEDWLLGGYEPNINIWGPLQGEHVLEHLLSIGGSWLITEPVEPMDPEGIYGRVSYYEEALPALEPDLTPEAGTLVETLPEDFYTPLSMVAPLVRPPAQVRRLQDSAQLVWEGGDPGVDLPEVILERLDDGGEWVEVLTPSGRPVSDALPDILLANTPDPLYPFEDPQNHRWWAIWQAADHVGHRSDLPLGTYRLHVYGETYAGGGTTWPWPTEPYEVVSEPFEVVPAQISLRWEGELLAASIPVQGYRLIDLEGSSVGDNPVHDATLSWIGPDGVLETLTVEGSITGGVTRYEVAAPPEALSVEIVDRFGNRGTLEL
jgi:neutral ceramidase